jgi:peptidoglycan/xylan/chitin deacetylase (PgdA/CDA1 family)
MTADGLRDLAADPLFALGSHAVTHTMLSALASDAQEEELASSRAALAELTGVAPAAVAYPFGTLDAIDPATIHAAEAAGYRRGYVNTPGRLDPRRTPFALARHMVHDWPAAEFAAQLDRWFSAV